jgi:hypothetical protein
MESRTLTKLVPTNASALGSIRAAVFTFVLLDVLLTDFMDLGCLPTTVMRPTGIMQVLPWRFYDALVTPRGMLALKFLLVISLGASAAGYFTAASTKSAALLFLFYQGLIRSFGHFNHDEMPIAYILVVLAFTPCADAFSFDAWFRGVKQRAGAVVYGYPILLMRALVAWSYFSSALIKLRVAGFSYFNPDNLPAIAISHSLDNLHATHYRLAFWLPNFRAATTAIVVIVVLWELIFPLAIFSRVARPIILSFGILFHLATIFFMNVSFPYHLAAYLVFVDWPHLMKRLEKIPVVKQYGRRLRSSSASGLPAIHSH